MDEESEHGLGNECDFSIPDMQEFYVEIKSRRMECKKIKVHEIKI